MEWAHLNELRRKRGLMEIDEIAGLIDRGNIIFDPFSTLISSRIRIGTGNIIYPCVSLLCSEAANLIIGDNNTFYSNSLLEASTGPITIGSSNQFGEGGFTAKANRSGAEILIEDNGRYINGASVFGQTQLGAGSQILGPIVVDSCHLERGQSFRDPDPDLRAGLFKGSGIARNLLVPAGCVIAAVGTFSIESMQRQATFHPKV